VVNVAFPDIILVTLLAVSLYTDIKERKILNIVTVPAAGAGLLYNAAAGGLAAGLKVSLGGLLLGMGLLIIPFLMGGIGSGDVKLLGAIGALKGPVFVLYAGLASAIAGGLLAVLLLVYRGTLVQVLKNTAWGFATLKGSFLSGGNLIGGSFPYGIAIAAGTVFTLLTGWNTWLG
jgi:prepilin peptidase CpaA